MGNLLQLQSPEMDVRVRLMIFFTPNSRTKELSGYMSHVLLHCDQSDYSIANYMTIMTPFRMGKAS